MVVTAPTAPSAHPEHTPASTITIAKDTILRTIKFSYGLRAITIEEVNGGLGSASVLDVDEAGVAEPSRDFVE